MTLTIRTNLLLLTAILLPMLSKQACPPGTLRVAGTDKNWCIRRYSTAKTFCDAVKTCHSAGEKMIDKPVFDAMKANAIGVPSPDHLWVGLVDALNDRGSLDSHGAAAKSGWTWIYDGQVTQSGDNYFDLREPNDAFKQDCVTIYCRKNTLRDESCQAKNQFYCYFEDQATSPVKARSVPAVSKFFRVPFESITQPDPGCWMLLPGAHNLSACGLACFALEFNDCVAFYWHPIALRCVLLPYFDASLPLDRPPMSGSYSETLQWVKFARN